MIRLLVLDAGNTLGDFDAYGMDKIAALSPLPHDFVRQESRAFFHTTPEPTPALLEDFCEAVHVDVDQLPENWDACGFTAYPYAPDVVTAMIDATGAAAVVLSNIGCNTGPSRMLKLEHQFPMIKKTYTSYGMGLRKPDRRLWWRIAAEWGVEPHEIMHIGDFWDEDVRGALRAGCRAGFVWGTRDGNRVPPRADWPAEVENRVWFGQTLVDGCAAVRKAHHA